MCWTLYFFNGYGILDHGLLWLGMTSGHHKAIPEESQGEEHVNLIAFNLQGNLEKPDLCMWNDWLLF